MPRFDESPFTVVASGLGYPEGPVYRPDGSVLLVEIKAGTLHPFAGPVVDQDGVTRVAAGKTMSDDELGKMDYYVEGVASKLAKK